MSIMKKDTKIYEEVREVEYHIHSKEHWFGKSADQSGNNWATENGLTPFVCISGNADFGSDTNDEALVLGSEDTPVIAGNKYFDTHRIVVTALDETGIYVVRFIWGTGTMADAISAKQMSTVYLETNAATAIRAAGIPVEIRIPRILSGTKVWAQCKNGTDNATISFFVGLHEYNF